MILVFHFIFSDFSPMAGVAWAHSAEARHGHVATQWWILSLKSVLIQTRTSCSKLKFWWFWRLWRLWRIIDEPSSLHHRNFSELAASYFAVSGGIPDFVALRPSTRQIRAKAAMLAAEKMAEELMQGTDADSDGPASLPHGRTWWMLRIRLNYSLGRNE